MKHAIPVIPPASGVLEMHEIRQVLEGIEEKMEAEISAKQRTIDRQEEEPAPAAGIAGRKDPGNC